jgi:hypothetical protein
LIRKIEDFKYSDANEDEFSDDDNIPAKLKKHIERIDEKRFK